MSLTLFKNRDPLATTSGDLLRLRDEMERTFDRFFKEPFGYIEPNLLRREGWLPAVDVSENENEVTLRAELPGMTAKDVDISVTGHTLTLSGKKEEQQEKRGEAFYQCERRFGAFRRTLELPETADIDKVTAEADNGIVTVHVAKKPGAKPRQIEIKAAPKKVPVGA